MARGHALAGLEPGCVAAGDIGFRMAARLARAQMSDREAELELESTSVRRMQLPCRDQTAGAWASARCSAAGPPGPTEATYRK